jgi:hypothetical protein
MKDSYLEKTKYWRLNNRKHAPQKLHTSIYIYIYILRRVNTKEKYEKPTPLWQTPPIGLFKINRDAAVDN